MAPWGRKTRCQPIVAYHSMSQDIPYRCILRLTNYCLGLLAVSGDCQFWKSRTSSRIRRENSKSRPFESMLLGFHLDVSTVQVQELTGPQISHFRCILSYSELMDCMLHIWLMVLNSLHLTSNISQFPYIVLNCQNAFFLNVTISNV